MGVPAPEHLLHLEHLLRAMRCGNSRPIQFYVVGDVGIFTDGKIEHYFNLTLSVSENLDNKEFCEFIYSILCNESEYEHHTKERE